jgi:choline dehydrogenase-like flavoprotein
MFRTSGSGTLIAQQWWVQFKGQQFSIPQHINWVGLEMVTWGGINNLLSNLDLLLFYNMSLNFALKNTHTLQRSRWPRGKILGGSSRLNFMVYLRGDPRDFDEWENQGNAGWGYKDVLPFFKHAEKQQGSYKHDSRSLLCSYTYIGSFDGGGEF